jgi:putative PEP-CTERM system TPR-repeat lipoprotein
MIPPTFFRSLRTASLIVAACVGLAGCGGKTPDALVASAKGYLAKNEVNAAIVELKNALQKSPDLPEARFLLGKTLLDGDDPVGAEIELAKASDLGRSDEEVLPLLAKAQLLQGKTERVIHDYAEVNLTSPTASAALKTVVATAYAAQGDRKRAQAGVEEVLHAVPGWAPALLLQARLKAIDGQADAALALVDEILAKDPSDFQAHHLKGSLLLAKGDAAGALESERRALALHKDWLPAQTAVLEILVSRQERDAAKAQLAELKKAHPGHPQTTYFEALVAYLDGDSKSAHELIQHAMKAGFENENVLLLAGTLEMQAGSLTQAESFAGKAVSLSPTSPAPRRLLAQIQLRSGATAKARQTLSPLLDGPNVDVGTLNLAGQIALQSGDWKGAEAYFAKAAALDPKDPKSGIALATAQIAKGDTEAGLARLQEIAASDQGVDADLAIIRARTRQRDYDAALKAIDALERKKPGTALTAELRGEVQAAREDFAGARQSFEKALSIDPLSFAAAAGLSNLDLREKKPEDARKRFDKLLAADPKNLSTRLAVAKVLAATGASNEEVADRLAEAVKLNPQDPGARIVLIDWLLSARNYKAALSAAQDAAAAFPGRYEVLDALGRAQAASGDLDQAIGTFNKLASMQPLSPEPQLRLAETYRLRGNIDAARRSLNRALEITPRLIAAQVGLVQLELSAGRPEAAMAVARTVQGERPKESVGYMLAGDVESSRKSWSAAIAAYHAALERGKSTELAAKLYDALASAQQTANAQRFASDWLKEHPQDAAFRLHLGDVAVGRQDFEAAETHYLAALQLLPDNPAALNNVAWVMNRLKKPGAITYAEKAVAMRPREPAFLDTLATIATDQGDLNRAVELQGSAVALAPYRPDYRLKLAKLYLRKGDKARAKAELQSLAEERFSGQAEVAELLRSL